MELAGRKVAVLGAGRSGAAAARLALDLGGEVTVYDSAGPEAFGAVPSGSATAPNAKVQTGRDCDAEVVIISPGIETDGAFASAFAHGAREFIGETEFASRIYEGKVVGITGTNGKTTTTELVDRILRAAGITCEACGNHGRPLSDVILGGAAPEAVALELSSFQLETIQSFRPDVAVWLNFSPDHMDRYCTVDDYRRAKLRIFENQQVGDAAVVRLGEDIEGIKVPVTTFAATQGGGDFRLSGTRVLAHGEELLDLAGTKLRGVHNAENAMAALAAVQALHVSAGVALDALTSYAPPLHRCELVRTLDGVEYINDSKATNLHALESALRSQDRPTVLIAGGKDKGLDYRDILPQLSMHVRAAVVLGEIAEELGRLFAEAVEVRRAETLEEAVETARQLAEPGGTVLFSPGTSSFDMFRGYEERGDVFREAAKALK